MATALQLVSCVLQLSAPPAPKAVTSLPRTGVCTDSGRRTAAFGHGASPKAARARGRARRVMMQQHFDIAEETPELEDPYSRILARGHTGARRSREKC